MSAEVYQMISMVAFICGGILTLIAVILFIKFDIPSLIGELSGRTAEKKVQEIREQNRQAVSMRQRGPERRRKMPTYDAGTEKVSAKANVKAKAIVKEMPMRQDEATAVLDESTTVLSENYPEEEQTTVLSAAPEEEQTTVLSAEPEEEQTTILSAEPEEEQTTILSETSAEEDIEFSMVEDVMEVHTGETI